ncbi:hypothetical protein FQN54_008745 [Arachnomyces sp. PD_36]|nr:hypothetical protein FQN54_008745 [Arachnomyces sp. PD_36]
MPSPLVIRRVLVTGAVVGITITGTLYGAGLKMDQEVKQETRKREMATVDEKIQALESRRERLVRSRLGIEKQIEDLEVKRAKKAQQLAQQQREQRRATGQKREE